MAFVNPFDDEKSSSQAAPQTSGASAIAGSGSATGTAPQGTQPAAGQQGTGFTNIQSYLGLNDTSKLAGNNDYSGQIDGAVGTTKQAVDSGVYKGGNFDMNADRGYKGPDAAGAQQIFKSGMTDQTKKNAADDYVGALGNDDGRGAILRDQNKDKGYSRGMGAFDSALLTGSGQGDELYNSKKAALGTIQSKADDFSKTGAGQYVGGATDKSNALASKDAATVAQNQADKDRQTIAQSEAESREYNKRYPGGTGPIQYGPSDGYGVPTGQIDYQNKFKGLSGYLGY
jgi:hypothetical protein